MIDHSEVKERLVIGVQLKKARVLLQCTPEVVAKELNVTPQDIEKWEIEELKPSLKQLEALANLYGRRLDYFVRESSPLPERIQFRGKSGMTLKDLSFEAKRELSKFDDLCRTAYEFERMLKKKREIKLPSFKESELPQKIAKALRGILNVNDLPSPDLRDRLEGMGVRIFELPIPSDDFSGFSCWHTDYGPCILLNGKDTPGRRNFTLAHELAHLLYKHVAILCFIPVRISDVPQDKEQKANQFAIEFLLPQSIIDDFKGRFLSFTPSAKELGQMASKWGVSIQALGYRLESFKLIKKGHTDTLLEPKPFFRRPKVPKWKRQLGKQYLDTTFDVYQKGLISIGKLARGLGISVAEALQEVENRYK